MSSRVLNPPLKKWTSHYMQCKNAGLQSYVQQEQVKPRFKLPHLATSSCNSLHQALCKRRKNIPQPPVSSTELWPMPEYTRFSPLYSRKKESEWKILILTWEKRQYYNTTVYIKKKKYNPNWNHTRNLNFHVFGFSGLCFYHLSSII